MNLDPIGITRSIAGVDGTDRVAARPGTRSTDPSEPEGATLDASDLDRLVAAAKAVPDVRSERVAALAAAIARNAYQVPIETLARRLLGRG
jgi:anti-sigma28 factor (negative regulator of flagellin synthesis)